jgi:hypothetical protein
MKKIGIITIVTVSVITSACSGISQERLRSSDRVEQIVMTRPTPSEAQCRRAERVLSDPQTSAEDRHAAEDIRSRCNRTAAR